MGKKGLSMFFIIVLFLILIPFVSAPFGYDTDDGSEVTINTWTGNLTNLSELLDIDVAGVNDDDVLTYNSATGKWEDQVPTAGSETDPLWTGNQSLYSTTSTIVGWGFYNSTDFNYNDYRLLTNVSFIGNLSTTLDYCIEGGACLSVVAGGGITWGQATNGTLAEMSDILGFSYYNSTDFSISDYLLISNWNATNTSYMLYSDWNATNTSYYLASNPFGFYNSTDFNYNDYRLLTNYTFMDNVSSTVDFCIDGGTCLSVVAGGGISWAEATNGTLYLSSNPFSFYNSTDFDINDYLLQSNTTLAGNYSATEDFCIADGACISGISAGGEPRWDANYSDFLTHIDWSKATNGTLFTTALFNTNYTANDEAYRSIINASYYLATNPFSFYNSTDFDYNDYLLLTDWNATNTSYYLGSNPFGFYNSTDFDIADYSITSDILGWDYYNSSIFDYNDYLLLTDWNATNTSYYLTSNPFGFYNSTNPSPETLWNANYSTFLTHIDWAKVVNGTMATWVQVMNGTVVADRITWATAYNGTLAKTDDTNTFSAINTHTANISMGNNYIVNGTGGAYIRHNGTGWLIQG